MKDRPANISERDMQGMIANPYYAITLDAGLFGPHEPMITREQWVAANTRLIEEMGAAAYLHRLLNTLAGDFPASSEPDDAHPNRH